jgi:hypothetical protein
VLGIHASDKWIRIRILDQDAAIFIVDLEDASKKQIYTKIFCLLVYDGRLASLFIDIKSRVTK